MNNKLKIIIASALISSSAAALADTAGENQTVSVTVPSVKLLDVKSATGTSTAADEAGTLSMTLIAPTVAGENFASVDSTGYIDLTSNVASGSATTRKVTVSADTLGEGWKLDIDSTATTIGTGATISFLSSDVASKDLITSIGNEAGKDNELTYTLGPEAAGIVPSYTGADGTTSENVTLTFTMTDDA